MFPASNCYALGKVMKVGSMSCGPWTTSIIIDHELLMRAVRKHAKDAWVVLYVSRWLTAPAQDEEGRLTERGKGTPQGEVITPLAESRARLEIAALRHNPRP